MYTNKWTIDGLPVGFIKRVGTKYYEVRFEREFASIEDIEKINWDAPNIQKLGSEECPLPQGKFAKTNLTYNDTRKSYSQIVELRAESFGDVSAYVEKLEHASAELAESEQNAQQLASDLSEADNTVATLYEVLSESEATNAAQAAQIEQLNADLAEADETVAALYEQIEG